MRSRSAVLAGARTRSIRVLTATVAAAVMLPAMSALTVVTPTANAFSRQGLPVEYLDVYSESMGRNISVEYQGPGPAGSSSGPAKAVYLLDGLDAQDDYSGWDVNTSAFDWFYNSGIATVMPVGGQSSFYSDWYSPSNFNKQPYTYKWETFLTSELPQFLAADKQVSPTGNAVVGVSMSGGAALTLAAYHPSQFRYAGSLSGFLTPSAPPMQQAIRVAMIAAGGYNVDNMWGAPWDPAWKRNDPVEQVQTLVDNGTRLWIYCAPGGAAATETNLAVTADSLEAQALDANKAFQQAYLQAGGKNATFTFPPAGTDSWESWGAQLQALKPDLIAAVNSR